MPVIKKPAEKKQIRLRLDEFFLKDIEEYCEWANLPSIDYFIEHAAALVFKSDKEWKARLKNRNKKTDKTATI